MIRDLSTLNDTVRIFLYEHMKQFPSQLDKVSDL
jgi:hypothetical protein